MAQVLTAKQIEKVVAQARVGGSKYPWAEWFRGGHGTGVKCEYGIDYTVDVEKFKTSARMWAKNHGGYMIAHLGDEHDGGRDVALIYMKGKRPVAGEAVAPVKAPKASRQRKAKADKAAPEVVAPAADKAPEGAAA